MGFQNFLTRSLHIYLSWRHDLKFIGAFSTLRCLKNDWFNLHASLVHSQSQHTTHESTIVVSFRNKSCSEPNEVDVTKFQIHDLDNSISLFPNTSLLFVEHVLNFPRYFVCKVNRFTSLFTASRQTNCSFCPLAMRLKILWKYFPSKTLCISMLSLFYMELKKIVNFSQRAERHLPHSWITNFPPERIDSRLLF